MLANTGQGWCSSSRSHALCATPLQCSIAYAERCQATLIPRRRPYDPMVRRWGRRRAGCASVSWRTITRSWFMRTAAEAASATGRLLERFGHTVEASYPSVILEPMETAINVVAAWQAREVEFLGELLGREIRADEMDSDNWAFTEMGKAVTARQYLAALEGYNSFSRAMAAWWASGFDILVTPTITRPSPKIGELVPDPAKPLEAFRRSAEL